MPHRRESTAEHAADVKVKRAEPAPTAQRTDGAQIAFPEVPPTTAPLTNMPRIRMHATDTEVLQRSRWGGPLKERGFRGLEIFYVT